MTVMQKMKIDTNTEDGLCRILSIGCKDLPDGKFEKWKNRYTEECTVCTAKRLLAEVPMKKVKQWELYNGDFRKANEEFTKKCNEMMCHGMDCPECFADWLMKEVEVESNE